MLRRAEWPVRRAILTMRTQVASGLKTGTCAPRHCFPRKNSGLPTTHATPKMIQEETVARKRKVTRPTQTAAPCKTLAEQHLYSERRVAKRQQSSPTKSREPA